MHGLVITPRHDHAEDHVGGEPEAVAELLEAHGEGDGPEALGLRRGQPHVGQVGEVDGEGHRPEPASEAVAGHEQPAKNAPQRQHGDTERAIHKANFRRGEAKAARVAIVEQKRRDERDELRFGEPIEQQESEHPHDSRLAEEAHHRPTEGRP